MTEHLLRDADGEATSDRPWIFRTYAGHTNVRASNELYRANLAKGVTGLSIAFDLPTQCGYSSDHSIAQPEVGKVGVPINSIDDFAVLFDQIPIEDINTSMTINGTAMWLLSLYIALAEERGVDVAALRGTTQNDLIKEFLARVELHCHTASVFGHRATQTFDLGFRQIRAGNGQWNPR